MFVSLDYTRDPERIHKYFSLLVNTALLVRIPLFAFVAVFHRQIVEVLFAGQFLQYSYLLPLVAAFSLGQVIGPPVTLVAQMEEKAQFVLASKIFGIVGVAASLLLIPRFGVVGAAVASGLAVMMKNFFIWWFVRNLAVWRNAGSYLLRSLLLWSAFAAAAVPLRGALIDHELAMLAAGLALWSLCVLVQVRIAMGPDERQIIGGLFSGREHKLLRIFGLA